MDETYELPTRAGGRRFRRALVGGLAASAALHAAVFLLWSAAPAPPAEADGAGTRAAPRAGGGGTMRALAVRLPERRPIPSPPRPVPVPDRPEVAVEAPPLAASFSAALPAAPAPVRGGPGRGGGSGEGSDAGSGEAGGSVSPPVPRSLFPEWDPPDELRGMRVTVRLRVDASGRPTGEVELHPPTPSRKFNRKLRQNVVRMAYYPARRDGRAVAGWAEITFVF